MRLLIYREIVKSRHLDADYKEKTSFFIFYLSHCKIFEQSFEDEEESVEEEK
jgi:hypothetical protein